VSCPLNASPEEVSAIARVTRCGLPTSVPRASIAHPDLFESARATESHVPVLPVPHERGTVPRYPRSGTVRGCNAMTSRSTRAKNTRLVGHGFGPHDAPFGFRSTRPMRRSRAPIDGEFIGVAIGGQRGTKAVRRRHGRRGARRTCRERSRMPWPLRRNPRLEPRRLRACRHAAGNPQAEREEPFHVSRCARSCSRRAEWNGIDDESVYTQPRASRRWNDACRIVARATSASGLCRRVVAGLLGLGSGSSSAGADVLIP